MKKILVIEIVILALVLLTLGAGIVYFNFFAPPPEAPVTTLDPASTVAPTEAPTTAPTEETLADEIPVPDWNGWDQIPEDRTINAQHYFVYDLQTGGFIALSGTEDTRVYPASITKLVTVLVALEYLDTGAMITAGAELDLLDPDSSLAYVSKGDTLSVAQLVEGMLLPSGNDAAYVLAAAAGRKILGRQDATASEAIAAFVKQMNRWAEAKGLAGSHFMNPDGIHNDNHYLTIGDLALLGKLSMESITVRYYAGLVDGCNPAYDALNTDPKAPKQWRNTNALIRQDSSYYCPYAMGLKTGFTTKAGNCLLSAYSYNNRRYIIGVFGCTQSEYRFADSLQLFLYHIVQTQ